MAGFDLLVRGGWVARRHRGAGVPGRVAVTGGRIAAIGRLDAAQAGTGIDATGRYVAPGLVDAHVHGDAAVLDPAVQLAALRQGVTTFVLGQDGLSYAPATAAALAYVTRYFDAVNGAHPALPDGPRERGRPARPRTTARPRSTRRTWCPTAPSGMRCWAAPGGHPTADELAAMVDLVERGLDEGAAGLSTGLEYVPGRYADAAELAALCQPAAARGLPYVTHMRGYEAAAPIGMAEATADGAHRRGGRPRVALPRAGRARWPSWSTRPASAGLDVTFDSYPYRRGSSILAMVGLPADLQDGDLDRTVEALADPAVRRAIAERHRSRAVAADYAVVRTG